jgi:RNA polymerase sigma-70 factor (ECF subfamily)
MTQGDGPARPDMETLIADHSAALYAYAYRLSGSAAEAEDLTQQTFLIAHQKAEQIRDHSKARGWLFRVLRNCFLKSRRKPEPSTPGPTETDVDALPEIVSVTDIDGQRLQMALNQLPDAFRLVLVMFYFDEYSYKEIAEQLEIKIGTVMSRLARAKSRLRAELAPAVQDGSLGCVYSPESLQEPTG